MTQCKDSASFMARAWIVTRLDGMQFGFTDHDEDLQVEGVLCSARSSLNGAALVQASGLSVDNSEITGALSSGLISDADISAGLFDGANLSLYSLDWHNPERAQQIFAGSFGEIERQDGQFRVELRGLAEPLNRPQGRVISSDCAAQLGDKSCGVDLEDPDFHFETVLTLSGEDFITAQSGSFPQGWFERGSVMDANGARFAIKRDRLQGDQRILTLWSGTPTLGAVTLFAGCDKRFGTCRDKFQNAPQFQGFPHVPGEDWLMQYPSPYLEMDT